MLYTMYNPALVMLPSFKVRVDSKCLSASHIDYVEWEDGGADFFTQGYCDRCSHSA